MMKYQKHYELVTFHGLKKPHPDDKLVEVIAVDNIEAGDDAVFSSKCFYGFR